MIRCGVIFEEGYRSVNGICRIVGLHGVGACPACVPRLPASLATLQASPYRLQPSGHALKIDNRALSSRWQQNRDC
jgi:hypothetical protein